MEKLLEKYPEAKASFDLLQSLSVEIAKEEDAYIEGRKQIEARAHDFGELKNSLIDAHRKMVIATEPMRRHRESIIKHLTALQSTMPLYMAVPA